MIYIELDTDYGAKHDHHGCADPVLVDDVVRVRAIGSEGAPAWVAQEDGLLSAAHDSRTMNHQIWKVESERTAGPFWTGDYVYFLGEGAEGPAYIDAPPPQGRCAPLAARRKDRGTGRNLSSTRARELDAQVDARHAVCYGETRWPPADALRDLRGHAPGPRPRAVETSGATGGEGRAVRDAARGGRPRRGALTFLWFSRPSDGNALPCARPRRPFA